MNAKRLGILGGGQLGRMFTQAAQRLGFEVVVYSPELDSPAGSVAEYEIFAPYEEHESLDNFASLTQYISTEFENVPSDTLRYLSNVESVKLVSPSANAVEIVQDRIKEKSFVKSLDIGLAPYASIKSDEDLVQENFTGLYPGILKIASLGYDGKGQIPASNFDELKNAFETLGKKPCVFEKKLNLKMEISVVLARNKNGEIKTYPISVNTHKNGILHMSEIGLHSFSDSIKDEVNSIATEIAKKLNYVGVLCVEMFWLEDGTICVNEIAPRPHNSGHFSIEACSCSQFEQQARILGDLPLGDTNLIQPVIMLNILGDAWFVNSDENGEPIEPSWAEILKMPGVNLHLYGKKEARPGRKMGHVTVMLKDSHKVRETAKKIIEILKL